MSAKMFDLIVVGGGTAGVVIASRIRQRKPELSILLIEGGPDVTNHAHVKVPAEGALLHFSELDYKYMTVPQKHLNGLPRYNCGVKGLSGGTIINYGGWMRGDAQDYDGWAKLVDDQRWSYNGLLPYFKRTETHFNPEASAEIHGFDGPVHTASVSSSGRKFPLREASFKMWSQLGLEHNADANNGNPRGIGELVESWHDGRRQITSSVYPLNGVTVLTNTFVRRVLINENKVTEGVELRDGEKHMLKPGGQIVISCGAYRTPKTLMLSGIGDPAQIENHGIEPLVDLPQVGQNLHDHLGLYRFWKLRTPEKGFALGSPSFTGPNFDKGGPIDWVVITPIPAAPLGEALAKDEDDFSVDHPLLSNRSHLEMGMVYAPLGAEAQGLQIPIDGSTVTTFYMGCLPTSRGSVTLDSADPQSNPVIDPNYFATETDKHVLREGFRMMNEIVYNSPEGKSFIAEEWTPPGFPVLEREITNEQIDQRIKHGGSSLFHPAGTAAMGTVVDGSLNVKGVKNLKVADASIIPVPLAAHYQAIVYAIAEQAVDVIVSEFTAQE